MKHIIPSLVICLFFFSCEDKWKDYYDKAAVTSDLNLYEQIKQDESLSKFARLIEISGYDKVLSASQTYTVWAPENESLSIDLNTIDSIQARLLVGNQIARFNNPTSTLKTQLIRMLNKKIYFYSEDGGLKFGGKLLVKKNIPAKNGLLHTTNGFIPYLGNIYAFINSNENTSHISGFIDQFQENVFDPSLSIPVDSDNGMIIYDSITTPYNRLFEEYRYGLGSINTEDSIYTMLVPSNRAWEAAYSKIEPYFKIYNKNTLYADSVKKVQTSLAIINNLIFRGRITDPCSMNSITSTFRFGKETVFYDVNSLFSGSEAINTSNGLVYLTGELRLNSVETWNKPIIVEAEDASRCTANANTNTTPHTITINSPVQDVSENRYIYVTPTTTSAQASITFIIPDVLSCKYDIYADFLPNIDDNNVFRNDSTKLAFTLSYMDGAGNTKTSTANAASLMTSGTKKVKMKIFSGFEFPVSNYYDQLWYMNPLNKPENLVNTTTLTIRSNVTGNEVTSKVYTRNFSIDRIILEPAKN